MEGKRCPTQLSFQDLVDTIGQVQEGLKYYQQIRHHLRTSGIRLLLPWMPRPVLLISFYIYNFFILEIPRPVRCTICPV